MYFPLICIQTDKSKHWRLRHTQLCCLQPPASPTLRGLMFPSFLAETIPKPSHLLQHLRAGGMQPAEISSGTLSHCHLLSQSPHQSRGNKNTLPVLGKLIKPTGISGIRTQLCITAVLEGSDEAEVTLLPMCPAQPAPAHPSTHGHGATAGPSGPGHLSQHDETSGGDAAQGVDGFLCYFLTVHIELDLGVAHGHMDLGSRREKSHVGALWWDEGLSY